MEYSYKKTGLELYDMRDDMGETRDVAAERPDVVKKLSAFGEQARADLGDALTGREGSGIRPAGVRTGVEKVAADSVAEASWK